MTVEILLRRGWTLLVMLKETRAIEFQYNILSLLINAGLGDIEGRFGIFPQVVVIQARGHMPLSFFLPREK